MCSQGRAISSIDVCDAPADDGLGGFFDCAYKRGRDAGLSDLRSFEQ